MRVIVAGGREVTDIALVESAIAASAFEITQLVSGHASGVDTIAERWATKRGVPIKEYDVSKAEWRRLGKPAGPMRNARMAAYADALIAIPTGGPGTVSMIEEALKRGLKVYVHGSGAVEALRVVARRRK